MLTEIITGKSSLAVRFVDGHFVESYYPTIENTFSKEIKWKNQDYSTEIVDTAGQVRSYFQSCSFSHLAPRWRGLYQGVTHLTDTGCFNRMNIRF